eukprot:scaffold19706_cov90-Isochrysis_galbana.AAC.1
MVPRSGGYPPLSVSDRLGKWWGDRSSASILDSSLRGGRGIGRRLRSELGGRIRLGSSTSWPASRSRSFSRASPDSCHRLCADVARRAVVLAAAPVGGRLPRVSGGLSAADCGRRSGSARDVAPYPVPHPRRPIDSLTDLASPVSAYLSDRWARWSGGATAARLAATSRQSSTGLSYGRHWAAFVAWCAGNALQPLPATPDMIAAYIGSIADRGTVAARSLQPYLSAINSVHADFGFDRPALGHFVAAVRRGLARAQAASSTRDTRIPLPAPAVEAVLNDTIAHLASRPSLHPRCWAAFLRARFAFLLAFLFMGRQDSTTLLRTEDV